MYKFKIDKIVLKNGEEIIPNKINIIVGPNSGGKSTFLKDIRSVLDPTNMYERKFLDKIIFDMPKSSQDVIKSYDLDKRIYNQEDSTFFKDYIGSRWTNTIKETTLNDFIENYNWYIVKNWQDELEKMISNNDVAKFLSLYGHFFVNYLGTEEKLLAIKTQKKYSSQDKQTNFLSELIFMDNVLDDLSKAVKLAFEKAVKLDIVTLGSKIGFRVGTDFTEYDKIKNNRNSEKKDYLEKCTILDYEGDGIKNFVATFLFLRFPYKNIILLDEPESYLHPPVARRMGKVIAQSIDADKQIFVATHSAEIIKGIILNSRKNIADINIVYIRNERNKRTIKTVNVTDIKDLVGNSTILFSNILNGLFSKTVYITESYNDSYFYDALFNKVGDIDDYYFVNAQGKSEIYRIFNFFKELGAKTTAIYDFDFFRKKDEIKNLLHDRIDEIKYNNIINFHQDLKQYIDDMAKEKVTIKGISEKGQKSEMDAIKDEIFHLKGLNGLNDDLKKRGLEIIEFLREINIVVLKTGALETTLSDEGLKDTTNKKNWIQDAITLIETSTKIKVKNMEIYKILK